MRFIAVLMSAFMASTAAMAADLKCSRIRLVVPYGAGGATDAASRLILEGLEAALQTPVIVETRAGATGNIGTAYVAQSPPDGCTLVVNGAVIATFPDSFTKLTYDPLKDLVAVGGLGVTPTVVVTANKEINSIKDLIAWSEKKPDGLSYGSAGYGLLQHLAIEELADKHKAKLVHVPYRGGGDATTDLMTGRLDFGSFAAGSVVSLTDDGRVKIIGVVQPKRSDLTPNVPSFAEQGYPDINAGVHFMVFAPSGTPKDIVETLSAALAKVVGDPALKKRFANIGFDPTPISSEAANEIVRKTGAEWKPAIKRLGIKLD
jgi:tripartite-type tricarboxylate transporter receptor subunit TctC